MNCENIVLSESIRHEDQYHWILRTRNIQIRQVRGDREQTGQETGGGEDGIISWVWGVLLGH